MRIVVSDTGAGISDGETVPIVYAFRSPGRGTDRGRRDGSWAGALSASYATRCMGSIGVDSTLGQGSTFWVELASVDSPLERAELRRKLNAARVSRRIRR